MRADPDSDWPDRILRKIGRVGTTDLSSAELEVIRLYANGLHMADIARARGVEISTVKTQARTLCRRLAAKHIGHAAAIAVRQGLIN